MLTFEILIVLAVVAAATVFVGLRARAKMRSVKALANSSGPACPSSGNSCAGCPSTDCDLNNSDH